MSSRYRFLCILIFFIVLILGYENYETWSDLSTVTPKREWGKKVSSKPDLPPPAVAPKGVNPLEAFSVIAEKNIFSPDRKEFSVAEAAGAKAITRPQITLYGVVTGEDYQRASIINPGRPLYKGERETKTIKIGDMVGGYKLTKIMPDRIVMDARDDSFEVLLYDPRAHKRRVEARTPTQPAAVTSTPPASTPPEMTQPASLPSPPLVVTPPPAKPPVLTPRVDAALPGPAIPAAAPEGISQPAADVVAPTPPRPPDPGVQIRGRTTTPVPVKPADEGWD